MNSTLIKSAVRLIAPGLVLYSLYFLLRGHNEPGGGFIGSLLFCLGFILSNEFDASHVWWKRGLQRITDQALVLLACFCLILLCVIVVPMFVGKAPFEGIWGSFYVPLVGKLSSVLVFDLMVFGVVSVGVLCAYRAFSEGGKS